LEGAESGERVLVPLLTQNVNLRRKRDNWVRREIAFRQSAFEQRANIVPINLGGGPLDGYSAIDASNREHEAIAQISDVVHKLRRGEIPPPYSLRATPPEL
jgi:hypothetical protein